MHLRVVLLVLLIGVVLASMPHVIVKGQSTSTVSGTVRCGTGCYAVDLSDGSPIDSDFRIVAVMTIALDPDTGSPNPGLPTTNANASFDASALGHYELQGLLPGIYDGYVYANGYETTLFASGVKVLGGQNLSFDPYVNPCTGSGCGLPLSQSASQTTTVSLSNFSHQSTLVLIVIAVMAVAGSIHLFLRRKEQPKQMGALRRNLQNRREVE